MDRFAADPTDISEAILHAPGWARLGITAPSPRLREQAAIELARAVAARLEGSSAHEDGRQFSLKL
ncbi:MAG TPA: DUF6771 family protein [Sphingomonas sp.]|nr:DUF6771 family protein [Sphingomonas sp.]